MITIRTQEGSLIRCISVNKSRFGLSGYIGVGTADWEGDFELGAYKEEGTKDKILLNMMEHLDGVNRDRVFIMPEDK